MLVIQDGDTIHINKKTLGVGVIRLLHYLSQQQQNQGQNRLSNSVISVITYLDDILVIVNRTLILTVSRGPIKVLWIMKMVPSWEESLIKIQKNPKW